MSQPRNRPATDRCPGVLRPYLSGDGALVRLRAPAGRIRTAVLAALAWYAAEHGAPILQLTSRGNLQLRGLTDPLPDDLEPFVTHLGLLPSPTHEVMRNLIAAPSQIDLAIAYDEQLRATAELAQLPGRWLVAFDDGTGTMLGEPWDLSYHALDADHGVVRAAAGSGGRRVRRDDAAEILIELSLAAVNDLAAAGDGVWNVRELPPEAQVFRHLTERVSQMPLRQPLLPGVYGKDLLVGVPLGLLDPDQTATLITLCDQVLVTPWRSLWLLGAADVPGAVDRARSVGLVTDPDDGFTRVTACVGAPHCARTTTPTLQIARQLAEIAPSQTVHISGCDRRCGRPRRAQDLIAPTDLTEARTMLADMETIR